MIISFLTVPNSLLATAEPVHIKQSDFSCSIREQPGYDNVYSCINLTFPITRPWTRGHSVSSKIGKFRPDYTESHWRTHPWEPQHSQHSHLHTKYRENFYLKFFQGIISLCVCVCVRAASYRPLAAQKGCSCIKLALHKSPAPNCWLCSLQNVISNLCYRTVDKDKRFTQGTFKKHVFMKFLSSIHLPLPQDSSKKYGAGS
jgi:hypothetical protein